MVCRILFTYSLINGRVQDSEKRETQASVMARRGGGWIRGIHDSK